jgi:hypothetical protein
MGQFEIRIAAVRDLLQLGHQSVTTNEPQRFKVQLAVSVFNPPPQTDSASK